METVPWGTVTRNLSHSVYRCGSHKEISLLHFDVSS